MLKIENLKKIYNNNRGISNLTFQVNDGRTVALVGPNGAGKSTTLKIMAGVVKADSGTCSINGEETIKGTCKRDIGYLPDQPFIYERLTPIEFFNFVQSMKKINCIESLEKRMKDIGLWEYRNNKIQSFSLGMKKKVSLIAALIGDPKLAILDEPTNGFDTKSIIIMKEYIKELKEKGSIIIISSHILEFVGNVADETIFIKNGSISCKCSEKDKLEAIYKELYLSDS